MRISLGLAKLDRRNLRESLKFEVENIDQPHSMLKNAGSSAHLCNPTDTGIAFSQQCENLAKVTWTYRTFFGTHKTPTASP